METNAFTIVHAVLKGRQRGHDYHADCPYCGKPAVRGQTHFSYSEHGHKCFVCGSKGGLVALARKLGQELTAVPQPVKIKPPPKRAGWLDNAGALVAKFSAHPRRVALWQAHKPVSRAAILANSLGVGVLPSSQCRHPRLILPIYNEAGRVVCLRGRRLDCDCTKWLAAGGWSLGSLPLYNLAAMPVGGVLWLVENPVDALLVGQFTPYAGAATLSVSYWREEWAAAIVAKQPSLVIVAYDNDLPGNGGATRRAEMITAWPSETVPKARGVELTNTLRGIGVNAVLYDWKDAPPKSDIGGLLNKECRQ